MTIPATDPIQTPFYHYDLDLLDATLSAIKQTIGTEPNYHVHYAIKANANPMVLEKIRSYGFGVDCVSGGEIKKSIEAGFLCDSIVFAGVGKSDWEIALGLESGIFSFNVESLEELAVINEIALSKQMIANVCIRINPDVEAHTHSHITTGLAENKFGIAKADTIRSIRMAESMAGINFRGLHFHIGSQILDMTDFEELCHSINSLLKSLADERIVIPVVNVGGGLGIDYEQPNIHPIPDFKSYFDTFRKHLKVDKSQEVHFELGRAIVAQCGSLICKALYVKKGFSKEFVILDGGMTELIRPALYGALHKIENITKTKNLLLTDPIESHSKKKKYDVVGPICESSDVFANEYIMPETERNDFIAIRSVGAYGETMASTYNCRPIPKSYTTPMLASFLSL